MLDNWMGRGQKGSDGRDKVGLGTIRRPVIGLALGGGAARGFAHIGIIKTLVAHGIIPNVVVGTSIGAVVGGAYAAGHLDTAGGMGAQPAAAQHPRLSRHPPQRLRPDRRRQARRRARGHDGPEPDRGPAGEIRHRRDRGAHRPRDLADPWPHGRCDARLLRAARNLLAGADRRPLAGRWRAGQSGAGVGGARLRRRDRHRRQPLQRRLHPFDDDLFPRPVRGRTVSVDAGGRAGTRPAEARLRQILLRRAHHEARVLRRRRHGRASPP